MTLHEAIARLLTAAGKPLSAKEIASALNLNKWYEKKDGTPITIFQIHGRTKNYPGLFINDGGIVSLVPYNFRDHVHNYATWIAAKTSQGSFASSGIIKYAIKKSRLRSFAESFEKIDSTGFEFFHRNCCSELINAFKSRKITASYGRAAKIVAIYLKTAVILPNRADCNRSKVIHPPIDNILQNELSKIIGADSLRTVRWTKLNEGEYWDLVNYLRSKVEFFDWRLEEYWSPDIEQMQS